MKKLTSLAALLLLTATTAAARADQQQQNAQQPAEKPAPTQAAPGDKPQQPIEERASYMIGYNVGSNLKQQEIPINADLIIKGLRDALAGTKSTYTDEEIQATMTEFQQQMMAKQQARMQELGAKNKKEADDFLAANKSKQGVVTTASGLQYQILQQGNGPKPKETDQVTVHYKGTLLDGTVFDSSYDRGEPATFQVNQVIAGWVEALQLVNVGSKVKLFIPPALAYGDQGAGQEIGPNSLLVFEVELLKAEAGSAGAQPSEPLPGGDAQPEPEPQQGEQKPPQE